MKFLTSLVLMGLAGMVLVGCDQTSTDSLGTTTPTALQPPNVHLTASTTGLGARTPNAPEPPNRVVVYYTHRTFHCPPCLWIENTTRQTLKDTFPSELASGRLDFQQDRAKRNDVQWVSVVVVNTADGREVSHQNLEKAWELTGKFEEFRTYIVEAVRAALAKTK